MTSRTIRFDRDAEKTEKSKGGGGWTVYVCKQEMGN